MSSIAFIKFYLTPLYKVASANVDPPNGASLVNWNTFYIVKTGSILISGLFKSAIGFEALFGIMLNLLVIDSRNPDYLAVNPLH